jgi:hypothetical protein
MRLVIPVQWAIILMRGGIGCGDLDAAEGYADELQEAMDTFEPKVADDLALKAEFDEWSAPLRQAVSTLRTSVAAQRAALPPQVEFKSDAFDTWRWTPRQHARAAARKALRHGTGNVVADEQVAAHHWRLLLEDAVDPEQCLARVAWHERKVVEAGGVPEPAIVIPDDPVEVSAEEYKAAVRYKARKAL